MCQNSQNEQNAQLQKFMENGMPRRAIRTITHTLRQRALVANAEQKEQSANSTSTSTSSSSVSISASTSDTFTASDSENCDDDSGFYELTGEFRNAIETKQTTNRSVSALPSNEYLTKTTVLKCPFTANERVVRLPATAEKVQEQDILATLTQMTRNTLNRIKNIMQRSRLFTVLTGTTQPAHVVAICIVSVLIYTTWPEFFAIKKPRPQSTNNGGAIDDGAGGGATIAGIAYLGAFAIHFGAQIWMTFVSGLSLYFSLPRHTFGQCQQILFPKYFALNATLSIAMLILFVKYFLANSSSTAAGWLQLTILALKALIEVIVRLYLAPPMLRLMLEKYRIEEAIGSGREVGSLLVSGDLFQCPHYKRIHTSFRRIHMTIAIGNMLVLSATFVQLHFLAARIQFH